MVTSDNLSQALQNAPLKMIGARIRQARRSKGMTLDALGEAVGTSRHHLIRLEGAKHRPRPEMLSRIAEQTGKPLDFFLVEDSGEPNPFPAEAA